MTSNQPSTTLRDVIGLDNRPPRLSDSVLIMVDYQNTYRTGVMALEGAEEALAAGARLLERARAAGTPVVHVVNDAARTPSTTSAPTSGPSATKSPRRTASRSWSSSTPTPSTAPHWRRPWPTWARPPAAART
ncbi:hypothetical protein GCM10010353_37700 [Streptomyces chryseus]|nr:hypothetical protein GCM10010353_37700 [Streptomyces chryseus]